MALSGPWEGLSTVLAQSKHLMIDTLFILLGAHRVPSLLFSKNQVNFFQFLKRTTLFLSQGSGHVIEFYDSLEKLSTSMYFREYFKIY